MLHEACQRNCKVIEPWQNISLIINKGTKAIISKLTNKAKVYKQCVDMLFQIKKSLIYKIHFIFVKKVILGRNDRLS